VSPRPQEDEDAPRPLTGFFFGNVTNRLRLQKDEGRYLGEARTRCARSARRRVGWRSGGGAAARAASDLPPFSARAVTRAAR
jgi:hypothetical protein